MRDIQPTSWRCIAYNQASASENKIHADDVARRYGFRGGLVPGVTVYAYLVHPALVAWGVDWLAWGTARALFRKPVYDGDTVCVEPTLDGPRAYSGEVIDSQNVVCASGSVALPESRAEAPTRRGDPPSPAPDARPEATRVVLERLRERGMGSVRIEWKGQDSLDRYTRDLADMPALIRRDAGGFANPAFTLGLANWILAANVRLGPWIHVQSDVCNHAAVPLHSTLDVEARVVDLFERSGHEFVDLDVAVFLDGDRPALTAQHRAIYRLRELGSPA